MLSDAGATQSLMKTTRTRTIAMTGHINIGCPIEKMALPRVCLEKTGRAGQEVACKKLKQMDKK